MVSQPRGARVLTEELVLGWMDPSIGSRNTGDEIIADAVEAELANLLPGATVLRIPTQKWLGRHERKLVNACNHFVVGGTNILNGNIPQYMQWKLDPALLAALRGRTSLLAVGWWQYNNEPNVLSRTIWRELIASGTNSVRDNYTASILRSIGIDCRYTSCVTMWNLPEKIDIQERRPEGVIVTVTDYHRDPVRDFKLLSGLKQRYRSVIAWPQSERDEEYLKSLDRSVVLLGRRLDDFNDALTSGSYDFVGTRLHAGIRALQLGVKATIVAVDNRASEISKSTGLPVVSRQLTADDWKQIEDRSPIKLSIPVSQINAWRRDFALNSLI